MDLHHPVRLAATIALAFVALAGCRPSATGGSPASPPRVTAPTDDARQQLRDACAWLWSQQADDGGWHSGNYAVLRSGQAYTPFVLFTLLSVPEDEAPRPPDRIRRALYFIRSHTRADGVLGMADAELPEYPNYATAYALRCLILAGEPRDAELVARMTDYLIGEQYREVGGFAADSAPFGGWGFGGVRPAGDPGHMDLAHTRRVLESLRSAGVQDEKVFADAQRFLRLVQRHPDETRPQPGSGDSLDDAPLGVPYDGGFYFSPVVLDANKGRQETGDDGTNPYYRSYATTTCDGVLSLLAAGVPIDDPRVEDARQWLADHPQLDYPAGIPRDHPDPWGDALHFYHLAVRAEAYAALDMPGDWRTAIARQLSLGRRDDGSYTNTASPLMKEDDPLLATALAATALAYSLEP